jgi:cytochrome c553
MRMPDLNLLRNAAWTLLGIVAALAPSLATGEEPKAGERIFHQRCAVCHGEKGEGTEDYSQPLVGDKSVAELARLIHQTMPEDDPEMVVDEEARQVAEYLYDAFYSPIAQVRNAPPRIELSRLTVRQYQNAVADLLASFSSPGDSGAERGLRGEYFNDRRPRRDKRVIERTDAVVDLHFGEASPEPEKIGAEEFSIRWEGGVLAPDTGDYEFVVRTENAFRLWVNNPNQPLIDAWVRSGDGTEFRETIRLLGGRVYPLKLEFFKSKREKTSSISLQWKPPHHTEEVIPERNLARGRFNKLLVIGTPFPPDDRSMGYERGTAISKEWHEASTYAAIETAGYVAANLNELAGARSDSRDRDRRVREFCRTFVERAFRRPLTDEERAFYVDRRFEDADEETAVKRVVLLALKSPRFLYREIGAGDAYDTASRLALVLWDSVPDQKLLDAAAKGELSTPEQVRTQAERMANDPRTRSKLRAFLHLWLRVDHLENISKDQEQFPEFDEQVISDLRTSLDLFLDDVVWSESSDYRQLLLADSIYLNGRLAKLYGAELPEDAPFQKVAFDPQERAGVLSHPFLLTGFAYHGTSSPIHRGVFVARSLLGRMLKPPPVAVAPLSPDLHPDLTTRERVIEQTSPQMCMSCHSMINALGFPMEHFDAIGRYRTEEKGKPVDATGMYQSVSGTMAEFAGVRDLAAYLSANDESHTAFVQQLFHALVKQPVFAYPDQPQQLRRTFIEDNYHVQRLLVNIAITAAQ